jgi:RNA polymerase sigma factor (sigma-70 family)
MPESDASLVRKAAHGHPSAFSDLLRRHGQAIYGYLARRGGRDVADDLLSEVFLRAYAARDSYDSRCQDARPWLYGIARNVLREHWRRSGPERMAPLCGTDDPWPDVDARLDATTRLAAVRRALAGLAPSDREVLLLVIWEGLTPAEAAAASLEGRPRTSWVHLRRRRYRLLTVALAAMTLATIGSARPSSGSRRPGQRLAR